MQVSRPSGSAKSWFLRELLCVPDSPFDSIVCFYSLWQPLYEIVSPRTKFIKGLPEEVPEFDQALNHCFVFDDLADKVEKSKWATKLYTTGYHHQNLSVPPSKSIWVEGAAIAMPLSLPV